VARYLAWSPEAVEDIESIAAYIERDSKYYACTVVSRIVVVAESIPAHPRSGRIVPEINDPDFRERFVHKYRIIYRIESERILIAAVIHGNRQLEPLLGRVEVASGT
jgi:plasmid stabilization system protein ParE